MLSHCFTQTGFLSSLWLHPHCCTQREVAPSDPGFSSEKLLSTRIDCGMRVLVSDPFYVQFGTALFVKKSQVKFAKFVIVMSPMS